MPAPAPEPRREQRKKTLSKAQLRAQVNSKSITLTDVAQRQQKGKKYQLAYVAKKGKLQTYGKKLSFKQALNALGVTAITNSIYQKVSLTKAKFKNSYARSKLKKKQKKSNLWGIYADTQIAAKTLAFVTGANSAPEVHGYGNYGHYHDKHHLIHIWYGDAQKKIYDNMYSALLRRVK